MSQCVYSGIVIMTKWDGNGRLAYFSFINCFCKDIRLDEVIFGLIYDTTTRAFQVFKKEEYGMVDQ